MSKEGWIQGEKHLLYTDDTFSLYYEVQNDMPFLHCEVKKWSVKNFKQGLVKFLDSLDELLKSFPVVIAVIENGKFAEMAGGFYLQDFEYFGKTYKVYSWGQQQQ